MAEPVVLGLDFGDTEITAALCSLTGERLADAVVHPIAAEGARWNFELGVAAGQHLLRRDSARVELVAVGAAVSARTDEQRIELPDAISQWGPPALAGELRQSFGCGAVAVLGDLAAAACAEAGAGALRGWDPALYVRLGAQVASVAIVGGRLVLGANSAAGGVGAIARLDDRAALGARRAADGPSPSPRAPDLARSAMLAQRRAPRSAARAAPATLDQAIGDLGEALAATLVDRFAGLDPARVAVGGVRASWWPRLEPALLRALSSSVSHPPEVVLARFGGDGPLVGALAAGLEAARRAAADRALGGQPGAQRR
ncbi:MAG: ROK family protein [Actinomycetota bacterium]|nr:ROK family protein [Actinomycetota bacterium]